MTTPSSLVRLAAAVSAAGTIAVLAAVALGHDRFVGELTVETVSLAIAAVVAQLVPIRVRRGYLREEITTSTPATFAVLIMAGIPLAAVTALVASAIGDVGRGRSPLQVGFNGARAVLALCAAGAVLALLSDLPRDQSLHEEDLPAVAAAAAVLLGIELGLSGLASAMSQRTTLRAHVHSHGAFEIEVGVLLAGLAPVVVVVADFSFALLPVLLLCVVAVRRMAEQSLRRQHEANHDGLTDLCNRPGLATWLRRARTTGRAGDATVALALADLDRFKELNDTLGHAHGDRLLADLAQRLQDRAPESAVVARLGGDEFAALVIGDDGATAETAAGAIHGALAQPFDVAGLAVEVSASVGVACAGLTEASLEDLLRDADIAMYEAKRRGSRTERYRPQLDAHSPDRLTLLTDLRRAIAERRLELAFQPIVELQGEAVVGVEALVRWRDPVRGSVPPDEFIGLAEGSGLIGPLTELVLDRALAQSRELAAAGLPLRIAINLSTHSLLDDALAGWVCEALRRHDVRPDLLAFEITESSMMTDVDRARANLHALSELGVGLAVDDFGTGHSTLSYLSALPVDELKIDRSFVGRLVDSRADRAIVTATIGLADQLGLQAVAEGIETPEARDVLIEMGARLGQGYLFCAPLPATELGAWLSIHPGGTASCARS